MHMSAFVVIDIFMLLASQQTVARRGESQWGKERTEEHCTGGKAATIFHSHTKGERESSIQWLRKRAKRPAEKERASYSLYHDHFKEERRSASSLRSVTITQTSKRNGDDLSRCPHQNKLLFALSLICKNERVCIKTYLGFDQTVIRYHHTD